MRYRTNKRTGDRVSEIGIGSSYMYEAGAKEAVRALRRAVEGGINYFDLAAGDGTTFAMYGEALHDLREDVYLQIHFGADYSRGTYGWTLSLEAIKRSVDRQLRELRTDYIDYGFIHCQDEVSDWETYQDGGVYDYIRALQSAGVVRHVGLSSHTPSTIQRILDDADVDMLMFSVNPAYDYGQGEYANGSVDERSAVYRRCEAEGIGISVMKPFSAGQLLDARQSPFGCALTPHQCIRYCLDRPGVLTVLAGARGTDEVEALLSYHGQPEDATDYSAIAGFAPPTASGRCVYCNHCKPCPAGIDIGLVNKYYDLAKAGDGMAREHYRGLARNASDCLHCGHCDSRCPFSVPQSGRMRMISDFMGAH